MQLLMENSMLQCFRMFLRQHSEWWVYMMMAMDLAKVALVVAHNRPCKLWTGLVMILNPSLMYLYIKTPKVLFLNLDVMQESEFGSRRIPSTISFNNVSRNSIINNDWTERSLSRSKNYASQIKFRFFIFRYFGSKQFDWNRACNIFGRIRSRRVQIREVSTWSSFQ